MNPDTLKDAPKSERLAYYFQLLALPEGQRPTAENLRAWLDLSPSDEASYQRSQEQAVSLKPTQKRDVIVKDIIRPLLKQAGFKSAKQQWQKELDDCWLILHLKNSHYNSFVTGANFGLEISASSKSDPCGEWPEQWIGNQLAAISSLSFLPDAGYLSPYFGGHLYKIDGYRNYLPTDEPLEKIKAHIQEDLTRYVLPQLEALHALAEWEALRERLLARYEQKDMLLLRYYHIAVNLCCAESNRPQLVAFQKENHLTNEEITQHFADLQTILSYSPFPQNDAQGYILKSLEC